MVQIPKFIDLLKGWEHLHWNPKANLETIHRGYFIEYAGSLWAGQPNSQNTLEEILALGQREGFRHFTKIEKTEVCTGEKLWLFWGNMERLSNTFHVWIWNPNVARKLRRFLKAHPPAERMEATAV